MHTEEINILWYTGLSTTPLKTSSAGASSVNERVHEVPRLGNGMKFVNFSVLFA